MITHYKTCSSDYPEKRKNEPPKQTTVIETDFGIIHQCVDCGAFEIVQHRGKQPRKYQGLGCLLGR